MPELTEWESTTGGWVFIGFIYNLDLPTTAWKKDDRTLPTFPKRAAAQDTTLASGVVAPGLHRQSRLAAKKVLRKKICQWSHRQNERDYTESSVGRAGLICEKEEGDMTKVSGCVDDCAGGMRKPLQRS